MAAFRSFGGSFTDAQGSLISATGGTAGGDGGAIEVSAGNMSSILSEIDGYADDGTGGKLILDPTDIVIGKQRRWQRWFGNGQFRR